jgi:hypothetical protein
MNVEIMGLAIIRHSIHDLSPQCDRQLLCMAAESL